MKRPDFVVLRLNAEDAALAWEKVSAFLAPAIAQSDGLYRPEDIHEAVTTPGAWNLWLLAEGPEPLAAWITRLHAYKRDLVLEILFAGGIGMERWYGMALGETEKFARELGCSRLRCGGRRGWERNGYCLIGHLFERKLS